MSTSSLSNYLSEQKTRFLADHGEGWTIVVGNEAGDLDTVASSIGYAWLLSHAPTSETVGKAIALMTTSRQDFVLRPENVHALLQLAGIGEQFQELLCPEDLPKPNQCTNYCIDARVIAIVDHHEDEGKYFDTASPRVIEPSGSCASLVTRIIMSYPTLEIFPELATLLLSAILIDTRGLRKGGKALDVDHKASAWLLPRANVTGTSPDVHSGPTISTSAALSDHPLIQTLSSTLAAKKSATQDWMKERGLSVLGVLTTYRSRKDKGKREEMWVVDEESAGPQLPQSLFVGLETNEVLRLRRAKSGRHDFTRRFVARIYKQKNASATRKQVAPILKRTLEG
ncbi:DHH phosphoesterase [Melanogaster broomeanus]|nr:DHH phosphoesterase [Melanogaster broomeanus]